MLKPYIVSYKFYYDDKLESERTFTRLLDSPREEEYSGTDFESLWNFYDEWAALLPCNKWEFKKGKRFMQFYDAVFSCITAKNCKPWRFVISSIETDISMDELMRFKSEDVIQYLKERGMNTCPLKGE